MDDIIEKSLLGIITTNISDFACPVLLPLANGLVLLSHIDHHLGSGLGLRQIIDWMMYVEKYLNDDFWNTVFSPAAETTGMKKLAVITTAMCQKYLGLDNSITWCKIDCAQDDLLCDQLIEHILKHGNFGRKFDRKDTVSISRLRLLRNPAALLRTAQQYGKRNWKLLKKYPQLRSFAWLYQIIVWPFHAIRKGFTLKLLLKNHSQEKAESDFLAGLKQ